MSLDSLVSSALIARLSRHRIYQCLPSRALQRSIQREYLLQFPVALRHRYRVQSEHERAVDTRLASTQLLVLQKFLQLDWLPIQINQK